MGLETRLEVHAISGEPPIIATTGAGGAKWGMVHLYQWRGGEMALLLATSGNFLDVEEDADGRPAIDVTGNVLFPNVETDPPLPIERLSYRWDGVRYRATMPGSSLDRGVAAKDNPCGDLMRKPASPSADRVTTQTGGVFFAYARVADLASERLSIRFIPLGSKAQRLATVQLTSSTRLSREVVSFASLREDVADTATVLPLSPGAPAVREATVGLGCPPTPYFKLSPIGSAGVRAAAAGANAWTLTSLLRRRLGAGSPIWTVEARPVGSIESLALSVGDWVTVRATWAGGAYAATEITRPAQ